jgi:hypothetical protein
MATGKIRADSSSTYPYPRAKICARIRARYPPWVENHARARYPRISHAHGHAHVPANTCCIYVHKTRFYRKSTDIT